MKNTILLLIAATALFGEKFYADDPLNREPAPRDASGAVSRKISDYYDFFQHTFGHPGQPAKVDGKVVPAQAVNTLGEPMDGAWYTKRHYYQRMSIAELVRGPGNELPPAVDQKWTIVKAKSEGVTPGFEIVDARGRRFVLKFDPPGYPELATAPDVLVSKFFYALGYHVPENYIVYFTADQLKLKDGVMLKDARGNARPMTEKDLAALLATVHRDSDGRYRALASLYLEGKPLGPFKYYGTRKDDPNDTVPHEHRRDLRGLRVFAAWLGHDDSRAINTLDMLVKQGNTQYIRHHLIDFGSTLGSASYGPNSPRSGFEHVFEWKPAFRQMATFGFAPPEWAKAKYPRDPAIGRFEAAKFQPEKWVAEYPNPAFDNMLPEDAFWAAKQVINFTDDEIRAIVRTGQFSDPDTAEYLTRALIARRDKIGRAFLTGVLPLDRFAVQDSELTFENLAGESVYAIQWYRLDGAERIEGATSARIPAGEKGIVFAEIEAGGKTARVYVRAQAGEVAGVTRY